MLLLTGPPGSGKTSLVLDSFRAALARHDPQVRLLAPTATMARHIATNGTWRRLLTDPVNGTVLEASTTHHDPAHSSPKPSWPATPPAPGPAPGTSTTAGMPLRRYRRAAVALDQLFEQACLAVLSQRHRCTDVHEYLLRRVTR